MSSLERAQGFTKPPEPHSARPILDDIVTAHELLQAGCKLALILPPKPTTEVQISVGDMIEVYSVTRMRDNVKWSTPKIYLVRIRKLGMLVYPPRTKC